jgi:hypothetical protein
MGPVEQGLSYFDSIYIIFTHFLKGFDNSALKENTFAGNFIE